MEIGSDHLFVVAEIREKMPSKEEKKEGMKKEFGSETISRYELVNEELQSEYKEKIGKELEEQGKWVDIQLEEWRNKFREYMELTVSIRRGNEQPGERKNYGKK